MDDAAPGAGRGSPDRRPVTAPRRPPTRLEGSLGAFAALQAFVVAGRQAGWSLLFWWHAEAWPLTLLLWAGCLLVAAAAFLVAVALVRLAARGDATPAGPAFPRGLAAFALAALLLGAGLRLLPAGDIPPGVFADTVYGVLPVLRAPEGGWLAGGRFEGAPGMAVSPVLLVVARVVLGLAGGGEAGLVALAAVSGLAAVAAVGLLAREAAGGRIALLTLAVASLAGWPLRLSRWAWAESLTVACLAAGVAAALVAVRRGRAAWAAAAGVLGGVALHGHPSGLVVAGLLSIAAALAALRRRSGLRLLVAATLPLVLSLAFWAAVQLRWADSVSSRYGQVGLWAPARRAELARVPRALRLPAAVAFNLLEYTGLPFATGDPNARMGIPGEPLLSPALAIGAFAGLGLLARSAARGEKGALGLGALAAASLLAGIGASPDGAPNSLRVCVLAAPLLVAAALGLDALSRAFPARLARPAFRAGLLAALLVAFEVVPAYAVWPALPRVRAAFFAGQTDAARTRRDLAPAATLVDPAVIPHPDVFSVVAFGGRPLEPLREAGRATPAALASGRAPNRLWYVTDARGTAELAALGLSVARPASPEGPSVVLVVP